VEGAHRHRKSSPRVEIGLLGRERYLTFNGQVQVVVQGPGESTQVLAQQAVGLALQQGAGRRVHEPDDAPPIHGHHAALHLREHLLGAFLLGQYLSPQLSVLGRDRGVSGDASQQVDVVWVVHVARQLVIHGQKADGRSLPAHGEQYTGADGVEGREHLGALHNGVEAGDLAGVHRLGDGIRGQCKRRRHR